MWNVVNFPALSFIWSTKLYVGDHGKKTLLALFVCRIRIKHFPDTMLQKRHTQIRQQILRKIVYSI